MDPEIKRLAEAYYYTILPALDLLPDRMHSIAAERMLLAIGLQESRLHYRRQIGGPARGLWQFERGGGVAGVLRHTTTRELAEDICAARRVAPMASAVYDQLEHDDVLAAAFARLLLWTDPYPLPTTEPDGWSLYMRTWRPGKPHIRTWPGFWTAADRFLRSEREP